MAKSKYPFSLVDVANEDLKKYGKEIQIVEHTDEPGFYAVDILTVDSDGNTKDIEEFADNYYEHELSECVTDAKHYVMQKVLNDLNR